MFAIALKNLFYEKTKLFIGVISVALSVTLVMVLWGVYSGSIQQARALPNSSGADYWVSQKGARDMFHTVSILPAEAKSSLESIAGVDNVGAIVNSPTSAKVNGKDVTIGIIAFDQDSGLMRPWKIIEGTNNLSGRQIVIDKVIARINNVKLGDQVTISDTGFEVVGISEDTNPIAFQYTFILLDTFQNTVRAENKNIVSHYLVNSQLPEDELEKKVKPILPNAVVRLPQDIAEDNVGVIRHSFLNIVLFLVLVGAFVGILVIAITVYNATTEKIRDFAVLKAIGAKNSQLNRIVIIQSLFTSASGFLVGTVFFYLTQKIAPTAIPALDIVLPASGYVWIFAATLAMALVAALIPVRKLNKIDPVTVFNA
jgi:putative ABC transport system permease protein